jgi:multicomponent Na+:H+ antiporter subunit B
MPIVLLEGLLLLALIAIAIAIIFDKNLLSATIIYCAFSFVAMLLYTIAGAADVAFTEAIIGTISTVYFVIAIKSIGRKDGVGQTEGQSTGQKEKGRTADGRK